MTNSTGTASIYCRLSAAADDDSTGLYSQEADLRALAARHGLQVVNVHTDDGLSGALRDRPAFLAWLDDARSGRADHLLAWKLDRVSRGGPAGIARFLDVLDGLDADGKKVGDPVRFLSYADALDSSSPAWLVQASVMSAIAHSEREAMRGRMLRHRAANRESGRAVGGRKHWALTTAPKDGGGLSLVPIAKRAEGVRWALQHLRNGGSVTAIGREFADRGLHPNRGRWSVSMLRRMLRAPALYGATVHRGELLRDEDGTVRVDHGQAVLNYAEHLELCALLDGRATRRPPADSEPTLLAGLLLCDTCRRGLHPHRPSNPDRPATYRCPANGCTRPVSVMIKYADDYVEAEFLAHYADLTLTPAPPSAPPVDPAEMLRVREALQAIAARISEEDDEEEVVALVRQRKELRGRLASLEAVDVHEAALVPFTPTGETLGEEWAAAGDDVAARSAVLRKVWQAIVVLPGVRGRRFDGAERIRFVD